VPEQRPHSRRGSVPRPSDRVYHSYHPISTRHCPRIGLQTNDPKHELVVLAIYRATTTSSDPNLNESEVIAYEQADEVAGTGTHRGYFRRLYKDGDTDYGTYEGTHKTTVKEDGSWETTWENTWKDTGGTGKFKNIKGSGTSRGKATAEGALEEFEGEVEY